MVGDWVVRLSEYRGAPALRAAAYAFFWVKDQLLKKRFEPLPRHPRSLLIYSGGGGLGNAVFGGWFLG